MLNCGQTLKATVASQSREGGRNAIFKTQHTSYMTVMIITNNDNSCQYILKEHYVMHGIHRALLSPITVSSHHHCELQIISNASVKMKK